MDKKEGIMKDSKISVVVPIYNVENYINQCVDSILKQTYKNLEIVLVDDGSTDQSGSICDSYKEKDSRIIVIHKRNGGLSDARNTGLDVCKGDFISFVDSDDYLAPFFYEMMMGVAEKRGCDIVALKGGTSFWDREADPVLAKNKNEFTVRYLNAYDVLEKMLYQEIATGAPFKIYKKETFDGIRFPVGYLYEDVATTYKPFFKAEKCAIVEADIYAYRKRRDSIIRQSFSSKKMICLDIFDQLVNDKQLKEIGLQKAAKSRVYAMTYSVFLQVPRNDKKKQKIIWNKLKTVQKDIMFDTSRIMRKKNRYAAYVSMLGMNISYRIGRKFGQKGSMS